MSWRVAPALQKFRSQLDDTFPGRARPDGTIGDAAHSSRTSDHNPDGDGVVCAVDVKRLSASVDSDRLARALVRSRDPRIKYVISRGRMWSSYPARGYAAWAERPYDGPNAHADHMHLSVTQAGKRSVGSWSAVAALAKPQHSEEDIVASIDDLRTVVRDEINRLSGGPRRRDADGNVIDGDPQTISVADVYTLVEQLAARPCRCSCKAA